MVNLVKHDLQFILDQIKIAEKHAGGTPLSELVESPLLPYGLRTVDGSYNNLVEGREEWGAADNPFPRITDPYYRNETDDSITFGAGSQNPVVFTDGNYAEMGAPSQSQGLGGGTVVDADPRIISNLIVDQTLDNPAAIYAALLYSGVTGAGLMTGVTEIRAAKVALDTALTNAETATAQSATLQQALTSAQTAAQTAQTALTAAKADVALKLQAGTNADAAVTLAQEAVDAAETALDDVSPGTPEEIEAATNALTAANADLSAKQALAATAQGNLDAANSTVTSLTAAAALTASALAAAIEANIDAQSALTAAKANVVLKLQADTDADAAVTLAQEAVDAALAALASAPESQEAVAQLALAEDALDARATEAALTQVALDGANITVSSLTTTAEEVAGALADAIQANIDAQSALTAAKADVALKLQAGTDADAAVTLAQEAVDAAETALDDVSPGTPEEIEAATNALTAANADLSAKQALAATAQGNLDAANSTVATLTAEADEAAADVTAAAEALAAAQNAITDTNQAVINAKEALGDVLVEHGVETEGGSVVIPNVAPDEGLSAPYNGWFTLFGQFFDHGLDLVQKGNNGTIYIPLQPDDPLFNPATPHTNFMVLTRAPTNAVNLTTPWVDQNQTYTSSASHQMFLREYKFSVDTNGDGIADARPLATGKLLEGDRGLATWADVKEQARTVLGINLTDADVTNVPLFVMDEYGEFIRGTNGLPQLVVSLGPDNKFGGGDDVFLEGNLANPIPTAGAVRTNHAFLDDIAHAAVPVLVGGVLQADSDNAVGYKNADGTSGPVTSRGTQTAYDNEMLDAHYITGDGRGNENIGLSAVHHIFHSEHNHTVEQVKTRALESGDLAFLNEWLLNDVTTFPATPEAISALVWDGERLFQAARFTTEMQYQHLVFEEFARKIQPDVDIFVFNPSVDINPAIFAEFAHVVYRFGHSMLREEVASTNADGSNGSLDLFDAFLNPLAFGSDLIDHDMAAGAIVRGMTSQVGNEIDEFVTDVLRNQLLGIPLDLAALNIARGRDTGIPSLNEARRQFKEAANGDSQLDAYTSWTDFALNLKNPASIVNFIAAYGTHETITQATTAEAKRDAAWKIVFGGEGAPADRHAFLNATGAYAGGKLGGLEDIDLWVGGMAEKKMAFGGMLGSTFSFIFELQMENLQNADRFYYLSRVQGLNFLNELENNSFAKMVLNNTDLGETGYALPGDIFSVPDHVLYMERAMGTKFGYVDPVQEDPWLQAVSPMIERRDANNDGTDEYIRVNTNDHVLIQGSNGDDTIIAGGGDDSVWGRGGNDRIEAGYGVDKIHGGTGDDIITNSGTDIGEVDMFHGEEGNDVIHAGSGLALVFGNEGSDFIITGPDGKEAFGGTGNDFILGGEGSDFLLGNEGDDWIEAGNGFDTTAGDNSELMFNSSIIGHDVMFAGQNEHDFDAESGDDIMVQGESVMRSEGMWGFDWAIHKGNTEEADSDLTKPIFTTDAADILRDRFDAVEALSGWDKNDLLKGDNRGEPDPNAEPEVGENPNLAAAENTMVKHELSQAGVDRITGLRELLGTWASAPGTGDREGQIAFDDGNILLGGGGSDMIEGRGGNDLIDGDRWLNVRIEIRTPNGVTYSADSMAGQVYLQSDVLQGVVKPGAVAQFGGKTLNALMLDRDLNPGQLSIVREIVRDNGVGDIDTAVYWDVRANYTITSSPDGAILVSHTGFDPATVPAGVDARVSDGVDKLRNIERLSFADGVVNLTPPDLKLNAFDPGGTVADNFTNAAYSNSSGTRAWGGSWVETGDDNSATAAAGQIRITGNALQFDLGDGASIQRNVNLGGVSSARLSYSADPAGLDNGEAVRVLFSADGVTFTLLDTITGNGATVNRTFDLTGQFTASAAIRFETTAINAANEFVNIDNLIIDVTVPAASPSVDYETTFTEDGAAVTIASLPSITDDAPQMASARIVLTNAQPGDDFDIGSLAGTGITAATATVGGQIVLTLTGEASPSVYQQVIQSITFNNTSENPSTVDRIIEVTVNDGFMDSNVATTTVNVVAVNDVPSAGTDRIVTNFVNAEAFTLPEWVFLNNDSDAEGTPLAISGTSAGNNLTVTRSNGSITITDIGNTNGGSFTYTVGDGQASATGTVNVVRDTNAPINGGTGSDILVGNGASSTLEGGAGNDLVFAGAGNDTMTWGVTTFFGIEIANDGRDFVDGGAGTLDRFVVTGSNAAETFVVYAQAEAIAAGVTGLKADTEIVITRTVGGTTSVIAELDNIEEITINTSGGTDIVRAVGNFNPTSLNFNTITINGDEGDDTVDITPLQSAHRILFRSNGGNDTIVGTLRPQDVIELPAGALPADYELATDVNGVTTMSDGSHSIRFTSEGGLPQFGSGDGTGMPGTGTPGTGTPGTGTPGTGTPGTGTPGTGTPGTGTPGTGTPGTGTPGTGTPGTGTPGTGTPGTGTPGTGTPGTGTPGTGTPGTGTPGTGTPGTGTPGTGTPGTGTPGTGTPGTGTPGTGTPGTEAPVASVISGTAGNDVITGTAKNDILSGGEGNDIIDGGSGTDTVLLVGRDRADYSIRFENGNAIFTHRNGGSDGVDTIANVEMIRFTGPDLRAEATLERLYDSILDRAADQAGKSEWLKAHANGMSMHDIAEALIGSAEAGSLHGDMSNEKYVDTLYQSALNRSADQGGLHGWTSALDSGSLDRADVLLSFTNSAEKLASSVIEFDFNQSEAATLVRLYDTVFDRRPDQGGINDWLTANENGMSMHDIALGFIGSAEAQMFRGDMNDEEYVDMLYQGALGRSAEAEGRANWVNYLQNGGDRADALLSFTNSAEKMNLIGVVSTSIDTL